MTVAIQAAHGIVLLDDEDAALVEGASVSITKATYSTYVAIVRGRTRRRLARAIMNAPDGMVVDHINGNPLDNRRANLRICTVKENNWNRRRRIGGSSGFKGVVRVGTRWRAIIWPNGKQIYLGSFAEPEEAARAYDRAAREEYGEFACLNFPDPIAGDVRSARIHESTISPEAQDDHAG